MSTERNQAVPVREAVVCSDLRVWTCTVANSPDLSREVHHLQRGRELQEGDAPWLALTATRSHQPPGPREAQLSPLADHTGVGPTKVQSSVSLPSAVAKCYQPALCQPKTWCWKL